MSGVHSIRALDSLSGSTGGSGRGRALPLGLLGVFYFIRLVAPARAPFPWTSSRRRLALGQQGLGSHRGS